MPRFLLLAAILAGLASQAPAADDPKGIDFFEKHIRPVLVANCYQCHSASAKELKGELRLDTNEGVKKGGESGLVIIPGKPDESPLIKALRHEEGLEMPPNNKLPDSVVANFSKWIEMGAPDPRKPNVTTVGGKINVLEARKFWSFQPPKIVPPAPTKNTSWATTEIDRYLLTRLEAKNLQPVSDADRRTLIRRAYFDLIGIPPTPEEVEAFLAACSPSLPHSVSPSTANDRGKEGQRDRETKAFAAVIDRLLALPQFGERWGRHWLDIARYGESTSKERNIPYPFAWKYRDYVYDSVAADKPYDQFVREQIAGDLLPAKSDAQKNDMLTATGFLAIGPKSLNTRNVEQFRMDIADEQLDVATRGVMALSVACARCHDHKFDPIPTADYYAMVGIFRSTEVLAGVERGNNKRGYAGEYVHLTPSATGKKKEITQADKARLADLESQLTEAQQELRRAEKFAEVLKAGNKADIDRLEKKKANLKAKTKKAQRTEAQALARIADLTKDINDLKAGNSEGEAVMGVRDSARPENCRINIRGEVDDLGDESPRGYVRVLTYPNSPDVNPKQSGRMQLAMWMTSKNNPLTARVMANRVWYHLFGRGIVPTVDNFGALGEPPTNQPLLDYLAVRFMDNGWSVKKLIREVMLSRAYQLSSDHSDSNYAADPDNTLVWRMNRKRLEAEAIRDAVLHVAGSLDLKRPVGSLTQTITGGEIGRQARTAGLLTEVNYRSAYLPIVRGLVPEFLSLFDVADAELVTGQRDVTTIAPQALYMMNNPVVLKQSEVLANKLLNDSRFIDESSRVDHAFYAILGHPADNQTRADVLSFLTNYETMLPTNLKPDQRRLEAWTTLCHTLLASAEFRYVY